MRHEPSQLPTSTKIAQPPAEIKGFRRLDTVAEIRELAKNWRNCLAGYLFSVNDGTSAIYLSEQLEAVCSVGRHGRMGWFLLETKGPRNAASCTLSPGASLDFRAHKERPPHGGLSEIRSAALIRRL